MSKSFRGGKVKPLTIFKREDKRKWKKDKCIYIMQLKKS